MNFALQLDQLKHAILKKQRPMWPRERILAALRKGPITSHDLHRIGGYNASARVSNLRAAGYNIRAIRQPHQTFKYILDEEAPQLCGDCDQPKLGDLGCGCEERDEL